MLQAVLTKNLSYKPYYTVVYSVHTKPCMHLCYIGQFYLYSRVYRKLQISNLNRNNFLLDITGAFLKQIVCKISPHTVPVKDFLSYWRHNIKTKNDYYSILYCKLLLHSSETKNAIILLLFTYTEACSYSMLLHDASKLTAHLLASKPKNARF